MYLQFYLQCILRFEVLTATKNYHQPRQFGAYASVPITMEREESEMLDFCTESIRLITQDFINKPLLVNKLPVFQEREDALPHSKQPATDLETVEQSPHP
jgi:hypothetical protein